MQPDDETDDLQALLREEYAAPPLDEKFSADLIGKLQAEAAAEPVALASRPAKPRGWMLVIGLGLTAVAALVIAGIWIANLPPRGASREMARRTETGSDTKSGLASVTVLSKESKFESVTPYNRNDRTDSLSVMPERQNLSLPESENLSESLNDRVEVESKLSEARTAKTAKSVETLSRAQLPLDLAQESAPPEASKNLSVLSAEHKEWPNVAAVAEHAGMLYVLDSGVLYEVEPSSGTRRRVGDDDWPSAAAMTAAGEHLYIVNGGQLEEVDPKTGASRKLGESDWAGTKAIVTVEGKLYIARNGLLYRVSPQDGSRQVLHITGGSPKNREPKP